MIGKPLTTNDDIDENEPGKLFIGGLSWDTTEEKLKQYFSKFGEVIDTNVMKNPESGQSRGFGFITFSDPNTVNEVLNLGPHQLDGRVIDPKPSNTKAALRTKRNAQYPKVFLGGLPYNTTESDVRHSFEKYGKIIDVTIMYDHEKNRCKGFGFLTFEDEEKMNRCLAEHFVMVNGKKVEVKRAENRDGKSANNPWVSQNGMNASIAAYPGWRMTHSAYAYGAPTSASLSYSGWVAPPSQWGPNYHIGYPSYAPQVGPQYSNWNWTMNPATAATIPTQTSTVGGSTTPGLSVGPNTAGADLYKNTVTGIIPTQKQEYVGYGNYSNDSKYGQSSARSLYGISTESSTPNFIPYGCDTASVFTKLQ